MKKTAFRFLFIALLSLCVLGSALAAVGAADSTITLNASGSLSDALANASDGGTIQIDGKHTVSSSFVWPTYDKSITITGGELDLSALGSTVNIRGNITFDNMTLTLESGSTVYANGNRLVINEDVNVTNPMTSIYGGGSSGTTVASTDMTILSGSYYNIYGGSNNGTVTGSTKLVVGGNVNPSADHTLHSYTYLVFGGGNNDTIGGDTNLTFTGNATANYIFGGSAGGSAKIGGSKNVLMSGGQSMSLCGGNYRVDTGAGNVYLTVTGGLLQQLFGGNEYSAMQGDVYIRFLGGTVTRRIYGGCYNEYNENTSSWTTSSCVTGNIILSFGDEATLSFTKDGYSDHAVYAHSRYETIPSEEKGTVIYLSSTAYDKIKYKLGYIKVYSFSDVFGNYATQYGADVLFSGILSNVKSSDEAHIYTYSASGATVTEACSLCATPHSATATLKLRENASLTYTGSAIEPIEVAYEDTWRSERCIAVTYANNISVGTATATTSHITVIPCASLNFAIEKADTTAAPSLSKTDETIKGKADGAIIGLTTAMEYSSDGVSYTPVTNTHMNFAPGTYLVRIRETDNYNASASISLTIAEGRMLVVTFKDGNKTIASAEVEWNGSLNELPSIPAKEGYTQTAPAWDVTDFNGITSDMTVNAIYTINKYTVTFKSGNAVIATKTVSHGDTLRDIPVVPVKEGYNGAWDTSSFSQITGDMTVNALYTLKKYTVTFKISDTVVSTQTVDHGATLTDIPSIPAKEGYTQVAPSWDITDFTNITNDMTVNAVYTPNVYSITFVADGETVCVKTATHGNALADIPSVPEKLGYAGEWSEADFGIIAKDMTVNAIYTPKTYTVIFKIDGTTVATKTVEHGGAIVDIPNIPAKEGYTQTSPVWSVTDLTKITSDMTVEAVYTVNKYTITFKADNIIVDTFVVEHGASLTDIPTVPAKEGYTQTSPVWSVTDFANITSDVTVEAVYTVNKYTITFKADNTIVDTFVVEHGASLTDIPTVPAKEGYTAIWSNDQFDSIIGDISVEAVYTEIPTPPQESDTAPPEDNSTEQSTSKETSSASESESDTSVVPQNNSKNESPVIAVVIVSTLGIAACGGVSTFFIIKRKNKIK